MVSVFSYFRAGSSDSLGHIRFVFTRVFTRSEILLEWVALSYGHGYMKLIELHVTYQWVTYPSLRC